MDKTLAEIYGTNQVEEADVEKLAAAELAEQLTETGDAQIDDETLEALAQEVLAQNDGEETDEQAVSEPEMDGAQEKIAEADYLGRVMAHSFVQESKNIKLANWESGQGHPNFPQGENGTKGFMETQKPTPKARVSTKAESTSGGKGREAAKARLQRMRDRKANAHMTTGQRVSSALRSPKKSISEFASKAKGQIGAAASKAGKHIAAHKGAYGVGGAGLALAGAGGYAAKKHFEKKSSAVDTLAEQRALEVLAEAGYDVDAVLAAVQEAPAQEKVSQANAYDVLNETVDARADEILAGLIENGIIAVPEETEE